MQFLLRFKQISLHSGYIKHSFQKDRLVASQLPQLRDCCCGKARDKQRRQTITRCADRDVATHLVFEELARRRLLELPTATIGRLSEVNGPLNGNVSDILQDLLGLEGQNAEEYEVAFCNDALIVKLYVHAEFRLEGSKEVGLPC